MVIEMFNFWYFFWMFLQIGATVGLFFAFRNARPFVQNVVLFTLLMLGVAFHFLKMYIPPYGELVDGVWKIKTIGYKRMYEYYDMISQTQGATLKKTTFLDQLKKD